MLAVSARHARRVNAPKCRVALIASLSVVLARPTLAQAERSTKQTPGQAVMQRLAEALRAAEQGHEQTARRKLHEASQTLTLESLGKRFSKNEQRAVSRQIEALRRETKALADLSTKAPTRLIEESIAAVRKACIRCHVRHRLTNSVTAYPSRLAVLAGNVRVLKRDGQPRQRHGKVVVFVDGANSKSAPPLRKARMSQRNRRFVPEILPIRAGSVVEFPNNDRILHNVFSLSRAKPFDLEIYGSGKTKSVRFAKTGLIKVYCHIHPEMVAHILVLANDHFTVSDDDGFWCLPELPEGEYVLRTWHEFGGGTQQKLRVQGRRVTRIDLTLREKRVRAPHRNKFGRPYRGKYGK